MTLPISPPVGWAILTLVFVDELLLVAAVWVAGAAAGGWVAGLAAGLAVIAVWWAIASPKARYGGPLARLITKVLAVAAACGGLWWAGHERATVGLLVFSVAINALAQLPAVAKLPAEVGN